MEMVRGVVKCISQLLTHEQKLLWLEVAQDILNMVNHNANFLNRIINGGES